MPEGLNQKVGQRQNKGQREAQAVESPNQSLPILPSNKSPHFSPGRRMHEGRGFIASNLSVRL